MLMYTIYVDTFCNTPQPSGGFRKPSGRGEKIYPIDAEFSIVSGSANNLWSFRWTKTWHRGKVRDFA